MEQDTTIHKKIITYLRDQDSGSHQFQELHNPEIDDNRLIKIYFQNFRGDINDNPRGFRLTNAGQNVMKRYFTCYEIPLDRENFSVLTARHTLFLERNCKLPWAYESYTLYLYDRELALRLKLAGDIDILIESNFF